MLPLGTSILRSVAVICLRVHSEFVSDQLQAYTYFFHSTASSSQLYLRHISRQTGCTAAALQLHTRIVPTAGRMSHVYSVLRYPCLACRSAATTAVPAAMYGRADIAAGLCGLLVRVLRREPPPAEHLRPSGWPSVWQQVRAAAVRAAPRSVRRGDAIRITLLSPSG